MTKDQGSDLHTNASKDSPEVGMTGLTSSECGAPRLKAMLLGR